LRLVVTKFRSTQLLLNSHPSLLRFVLPVDNPSKPPETSRMSNTVSIVLPCKLNEEELRKKSEELASAVNELKELEERKREVMAEWKEKIDASKERVLLLAKAVHTRTEDRPVDCEEHPNLSRNCIEIYRTDSDGGGQLVRTRPMTLEEKESAQQLTLGMKGRQ